MSTGPTADDARETAEAVIKELEAEQVAQPEVKVEATPEPKAEEKPEVKSEPEAPKEEAKAEAPRPERKSAYVPVAKANQWRHEANDAKAEAAQLKAQLAEMQAKIEQAKAQDIDAVAKEIAGEDASPEVVKRILEATKKAAEPSEDIKSLLSLKQKLEEQAEEQGFQKELTQTLSRFPELKGHEAELRESAYAEGNEKVPLELLAYKLRDDLNLKAAPPSAEGKASQAKAAPETDYENLSDADVAAMSDEDMDRFIAWQRKQVHKRTGLRI